MSTQREISRGIQPIPAEYDIARDTFTFRDGREVYQWQSSELPFTLVTLSGGIKCADRELVVKHAEARLNGTEQFMPAWVDDVLGKSEITKRKADELELEMLRAFFDTWEHLHGIPNKPENRRKSEAAAQALVEAAHAIRTLRAPVVVERIADGG